MNILFLCARYKPEIGGVETHAYEVAQRCVAAGHTVNIFTEDQTNQSTQSPIQDKTHITQFKHISPGFLKKFKIWLELWRHHNLIQNADIIHCHDVFFWYLPFRFLYPTKKVFTTFHGYEGIVPPAQKAIIIRRLSNFLSQGSINVGHFIEKWYGTKSSFVVYGGHSGLSNFSSSELHHTKLNVALIGRLDRDIGIATYAAFFALLKKQKVPFSLDIYGDGPLRNLLEPHGTIHGYTENLDPVISKSDIICASSYLTILQALSHGKRILAVYENVLKKDYLTLAPFSMWITIADNPVKLVEHMKETLPRQSELKKYLTENTWDHVYKTYERLWKV